MLFPTPLERGRLVQRYKRFFADVAMNDGRAIIAHCPNPGAMLGVNTPGLEVWLSRSDDPKRKLAHTLELVRTAEGALTGVNTLHPNRIVAEALAQGVIPELAGYDLIRREVKYGEASRVDFLLTGEDRRPCWLEIKNVHLSRLPGLAEFPDCVAARSARHLRELSAMVALGERAVALFVVQRMDCERFAGCAELDPVFARALEDAGNAGVEVLCYDCDLNTERVVLRRRLPWQGSAGAATMGQDQSPVKFAP